MSLRTRTETHRPAPDRLGELVAAGPYFTDHVRLFRLSGVVFGSSGPKLVRLEDCRTLAEAEYTEEEVMLLGLAPVCAQDRSEEASRPARHREHGRRARAHQT